MGFLDDEEYSGTTKIDVGRGYWVEVLNCLPHDKFKVAEKLLTQATIVRDAEGGARSGDTSAYRDYMVKASIVAWNLDDGKGEDTRVWPYNNDGAIARGVGRLPGKVFQKIYDRVNELNGDRPKEETARFPDADEVGDQGGEAGASEPVEVGVGAVALAGARSEPAGVLRSAMA